MTAILDSAWSQTATRLAVGVEPHDIATGQRVRRGLDLRLETNASPVRGWRRFGGADTLTSLLPNVRQHASNRFAITMKRAEKAAETAPPRDAVRLRLVDLHRWYVPRRLNVALADHVAILQREEDPTLDAPPASNRVIRPFMYPGGAHPRAPRATGLAGRVLRNGTPMRWSRVMLEDRRTGQPVVTAHGDDRGEFVAILGQASGGTLPTGPIPVRVHVFGPALAPTSASDPELPDVDSLWDLPIEDLPVPARGVRPDVETGIALPPGYVATSTGPIDLDLPLGVVRSHDAPDFIFNAP